MLIAITVFHQSVYNEKLQHKQKHSKGHHTAGLPHHLVCFNLASMSFTPEIICAEIKKRLPAFTMDYNVDPVKKEIAESWPNSLDDTCAREEWGWKPEWDLSRMTDDMLAHIRTKLAAE